MKWFLIIVSLVFGVNIMATPKKNKLEIATFAGGCFWCMQEAFQKVPGVNNVVSGYAGGTGEKPNYNNYAQQHFVEVIQLNYDPAKISFKELLTIFWHNIDPTQENGQFGDHGPQYRSAIFYHNAKQKVLAIQSKQALITSKKINTVATEILPFTNFYPAEEYHQNYAQKNPLKYWWFARGRKKRLQQLWH